MQLLSPLTPPFSSATAPAQDAPRSLDGEQHASPHNRPRRDTTGATAAVPAPSSTNDADVPLFFMHKLGGAKTGPDSEAFMQGYNAHLRVEVPGYFAGMSGLALMRLGVDQQLRPEQLGALQRLMELRLIESARQNVGEFTKVLSAPGVKLTPMPQSLYLSILNPTSIGECQGITHVLSLAVKEGKQDTFFSNLFWALADPDAHESQAFFEQINKIQNAPSAQNLGAHDPATLRVAPYTTIAPELINSPTTKTLLITNMGDGKVKHRLSAGVMVAPDGGRTYYYHDANGAFAQFASKELFQEGLKKIYTSPELKSWYLPFEAGGYFTADKYQMSVFNPNVLPDFPPDSNAVKFLYSAPLSGLDTVKVIDASLLPKAGSLHVHSPPSEKAPLADYNKVRQGLETLHASQGMPQFHQTMSVLESVRDFIKAYPNSPLYASMKSVEQSLLNAINKATPPVEYPFAWERIETQRSHLDEDSIGRGRQSKKATVLGTNVHIQSAANSDPGKMARVLSAVETALHKLSQGDPHIAKAMGANFKVLIANPGELPESTLRLSNPPALVIGDDFFAPVSTDDTTVADRLGRESQVTGGDAVAHKQAAMICGKLGMLGYYKADSQGFLEVIRDKYVMRDGDTLSKRASRGPGDFVEEAYTARLYDGKLDSRTDAALNRLFTPVAETSDAVNKSTRGPGFSNSGTSPVLPAGASNSGVASNLPVGSSNVGAAPKAKPDGPRTQHPPSVFAPPPLKLEHVNDAEMLRLQKLDDVGPLITIGEKAFSRVELYKMGWSINGKPIDKVLADDPSGRQLADVMRLDYPSFKAYLRSGGSDDNAHDALAEIASQRSTGAPALIAGSDGSVLAETLQKSAHDLSRQADEIRKMLDGKKPLPADFFSSGTPGKQGATSSAGSGFQLFSTFQGLRSSIESIQRGDTTAGVIGLGAVGADYVGMGVETALNKVAEKVVTRAAPTILSFQASSVGKMIGKAARGGGSVISIPFDTYTAVDSFKKAGRSTGKEAQDHYVNGSFAVANAATSIALGAAFLAGASSAGPAGLIVAGGLMIAQAIYSAVRTVEDIDKYTPLTGGQKFTLGLTSFLGFPPGFKVMKPYLQAKYSQAHEEQTRANYKAFLEGPGKDHYERVVYGNTKVEVTEVPGKVPLTPSLWWNPPSWGLHQIKVDGKVPVANVRGGNDRINAPEESWNGMSIKPVEGVQGGGRGTFWVLSDGDDVVAGVMKKHNYFSFEGGKKLITGGDADDTFNFNADARQTLEQTRQVQDTEKNGFSPKASEIWGGDGTNTLSFSGELRTTYSVVGETETVAYSGHVINFKTGTVAANTLDSKTNGVTPIAYFHSFSNAVTVESGESFIQGDDQNNHLTLNGKKDVVLTGKGANVIVVNGGANIVGQGGFNTYEINKGNQAVTINDPVASVIKLDYSASQVFDWGVTPEGDLVATLHGDKPWEHRYLFIKNAYPDGSTEDTAKPTFVTNDGVMITINAPRKAGSDDRVVQVNRLKIDAPKV